MKDLYQFVFLIQREEFFSGTCHARDPLLVLILELPLNLSGNLGYRTDSLLSLSLSQSTLLVFSTFLFLPTEAYCLASVTLWFSTPLS